TSWAADGVPEVGARRPEAAGGAVADDATLTAREEGAMRSTWAALGVTLAVLAAAGDAAHASTANPGVLRARDLGGGYTVLAQPFHQAATPQSVVDAGSCMEAQRQQPNVSHTTVVSFSRAATGGGFIVYEEVRSFTRASTAARAFAAMRHAHDAEVGCDSL